LLLVSLFGSRPGALRLRLRFPQGATAFAERVEVIQLVADGLLLFLPPSLVDAGQPALQPLAAVADQVLQRGQLLELFGPLFAVATGGKPTGKPALTLGLNDHENGLLAEEDLVAGALVCPGPSVLIEESKQGT